MGQLSPSTTDSGNLTQPESQVVVLVFAHGPPFAVATAHSWGVAVVQR